MGKFSHLHVYLGNPDSSDYFDISHDNDNFDDVDGGHEILSPNHPQLIQSPKYPSVNTRLISSKRRKSIEYRRVSPLYTPNQAPSLITHYSCPAKRNGRGEGNLGCHDSMTSQARYTRNIAVRLSRLAHIVLAL